MMCGCANTMEIERRSNGTSITGHDVHDQLILRIPQHVTTTAIIFIIILVRSFSLVESTDQGRTAFQFLKGET
jgi:hypothetical protein